MVEKNDGNRRSKKTYEEPTATILTSEQAKLKLMGHAMMGDEGAKEMLARVFQEETQKKKKRPDKKDPQGEQKPA